MKRPNFKHAFALAMFSLSLAGCGGGGGGGGDSGSSTASTQASSTVTSQNADDVAAKSLAANGLMQGWSGAGTAYLASVPADSAGNRGKRGLIDFALQQVYRGLDTQASAQSTATTQYVCTNGGTIDMTATRATSGQWSNGDGFVVTYNNCVEGSLKYTGSIKSEFSDISGTPSSTSAWTATIKFTFTNVTTTSGANSSTVNGDMALAFNHASATDIRFTMTGTSFAVSAVSSGESSSQTLSAFTFSQAKTNGVYVSSTDFTLSGTFPTLGTVSYRVKTNTPFKSTGGYPYEGSMTVTATDNSALRLNVIDGTYVDILLDKNGDGVFEETHRTTWTALEARG